MSEAEFPLQSDEDHSCTMTFVEVGDVEIHYERAGSGAVCVLLHGGFTSHRSWDLVAKRLREHFDVITIDSRGQGRSSDGRGPITYGRMASDVVRIMDVLHVERANLIGHSDGGCNILHLLVDYPDRLSTATLVGTPLHLDDYRPGMREFMAGFLDAMAANGDDHGLGFAEHYRQLSPHPERWQQLALKLGATWKTQPIFSDDMLALVEVPVLVIGVEHDEFFDREVFARTSRVLPRSEVFWIENATHAVPMSHPISLADAVTSFIQKHS